MVQSSSNRNLSLKHLIIAHKGSYWKVIFLHVLVHRGRGVSVAIYGGRSVPCHCTPARDYSPDTIPTRTTPHGTAPPPNHKSMQYTSYWNAFLSNVLCLDDDATFLLDQYFTPVCAGPNRKLSLYVCVGGGAS